MTGPEAEVSCPAPKGRYENVVLAHGGGGALMQQLLERLFFPAFGGVGAKDRQDAAVLDVGGQRIAFTTDSFVVKPHRFPGGDIGSLAVHGTVNDLAMTGARPLWLSAAFILEEGFPMAELEAVTASMARAAHEARVTVVTGDTKVVDRGKGDGIFINTAGVGVLEHAAVTGPGAVRPGDAILVSGDLARHGMAIMASREGLEFESLIESDSAPLADLALSLFEAGIEVHCLRDLTRGGLASAMNEIAGAAGCGIVLDEAAIPVREDVRGACEILGFDPMYVANEGRFAAFVPGPSAGAALEVLRAHPLGEQAVKAGVTTEGGSARVAVETVAGTWRILGMLSGEQLPRIC